MNEEFARGIQVGMNITACALHFLTEQEKEGVWEYNAYDFCEYNFLKHQTHKDFNEAEIEFATKQILNFYRNKFLEKGFNV